MILLSSNGMDVVLTPTTLTWRVTGGVIDLIIVGGDGTPGSVAERVAAVVGRPTLVPYWAFGLMNSKYGYASAAQTERVLDSFEAAGVPVRTEGRQFLCCAVAAADSHLFPPLL
jgi:alpha-glucosidase (family GH31 glycosyl hydrolase)